MERYDSSTDLYGILQVPSDASPEIIKKQFLHLARLYHPDKITPENSHQSSHSPFVRLNRAYLTLKNPVTRNIYDRYGSAILDVLEEVEGSKKMEDADEPDQLEAEPSPTSLQEQIVKLENKIFKELRHREEVRITQLYNLQSRFVMAFSCNALMAERAQLHGQWLTSQYTAISSGVHWNINPWNLLVFNCSGHLQNNFAGVCRMSTTWKSQLDDKTTTKLDFHVMAVDLPYSTDLTIKRKFGQASAIQQKYSYSLAGLSLTTSVAQKLTDTINGSITWVSGSQPVAISQLVGRYGSVTYKLQVRTSHDDYRVVVQSIVTLNPYCDFSLRPSYSLQHGVQSEGVFLFFPGGKKDASSIECGFLWHPESFTLRLGFNRGGIAFEFPIELYSSSSPDLLNIQFSSFLIALACVPATCVSFAILAHRRNYWGLITQKISKLLYGNKTENELCSASGYETKDIQNPLMEVSFPRMKEAETEGQLLSKIADEKKKNESRKNGLVIEFALYGHPAFFFSVYRNLFCLNVTSSLMAMVQDSRLFISGGSFSSIIGFTEALDPNSNKHLFVKYTYKNCLYTKNISYKDSICLP